MAIISGTIVAWHLSPRIITIPAPIIEATIEDLQDTLLDLEAQEEGMVWPHLRNTSGGESLGGGVSVGLTMELQNAQLQFEGRTVATENGTCTANDSTGTILTASGGQFVTNGVTRGNTVFNATTGSMGTVLSVTSETELISQQITGGARTTWVNTDLYSIYSNVQCNISGGNLVAVDDVEAELSPVLQSPNTNVVRTSSSSATLQNQELLQISTFTGRDGLGISWDPAAGTDSIEYPYGVREFPVETEQNVLDLLAQKGFKNIYVMSTIFVVGDHSVGNSFYGDSVHNSFIFLQPTCDVTECRFIDAHIFGQMTDTNQVIGSIVNSVTDANGQFDNCILFGPIVMNNDLIIKQSYTAVEQTNEEVTIDFNSIAKKLSIRGWLGGRILIKNMVTGGLVEMAGAGGKITFDATCTGGDARLYGGIEHVNNGVLDNLDDDTLFTRTDEVRSLHGLKTGTSLVVDDDANTRTAGTITQTVNTVGNVTTVTRTG